MKASPAKGATPKQIWNLTFWDAQTRSAKNLSCSSERNKLGGTHFSRSESAGDSSSPLQTASKVLTLTVAPATSTLLITSTAFNQSTATVGTGAERCSQWQQWAALSLTVGRYPTQPVPDPPAPAQTDSKYMAFHEGRFLQVAVSEAPL